MTELKELLDRYEKIVSFTEAEIETLTDFGERVWLEQDEIIFQESDTSDSVYLVISGAVELFTRIHEDLDQTIIISTRCGQDSDCNPSNAAGVMFATYGMKNLPDKYTSELNRESVFSHTEYGFATLLDVCEKLAREAIDLAGGKTEKGADGKEVFVIPVQQPKPSKFETCWEPGPIADKETPHMRLLRGQTCPP